MNFPKIISLVTAWGYIPQKNIFKNFLLKRIGHPHPYGRLRAISVMKHIKSENKNILDAGCGTGTFSRELVLRGFKVTGVDTDNEAIKSCINNMQQLNLDYPVIKESIMDLKSFEDESFDVIISTDVIEHVQSPEKAISELKRVLKKDGQLIITVPTPLYLSKPILPLDFSKHLEEIGHLTEGWYEEDGITFLNKFGLKVERSFYFGFFPIRLILEFLYLIAGVKNIKKTRKNMYEVKWFPLIVYLGLCPFLYLEKLFSEKKRGAFIVFVTCKDN